MSSINKLLTEEPINGLIFKSGVARKAMPDLGFNLFRLISPIYHRENLHSDLLASLLDPKEDHGVGAEFLKLFIDWLNQQKAVHIKPIEALEFNNAVVKREPGKIDILIYDKDSSKAIIIENKIADAVDQERQIPRYLDHAEQNLGLEVVAVVYLRLKGLGAADGPHKLKWVAGDDKRVDKVLFPVKAYSEDDSSMLHGWLRKCDTLAAKFDSLAVIRQYTNLIEYLGKGEMNNEIMREFYQELTDVELFSKATEFCQMMEELPKFRANRIIEKFKEAGYLKKPFDHFFIWKDKSAVMTDYGGAGLSIDVVCCHHDHTNVLFWDRLERDPKIGTRRIDKAIKCMSGIDGFKPEGGRYSKRYEFPNGEVALDLELSKLLHELERTKNEWNELDLV